MNSCLGVRADNEVLRLGHPLEGSACVRGDLAVVHERPPLEVYALQSGSRNMR